MSLRVTHFPATSHQRWPQAFCSPLRGPTDIAVDSRNWATVNMVILHGANMWNCATVWGASNFHGFPPKFIKFSDKAVVPPLLYLSDPFSISCFRPVGVGGWLAKDLPATCTLIFCNHSIMNHLEDSYDGDCVKYSIKKHMSHLRSLPRSSPMPSRFLKLHVGCAADFAVQPG